VVGRMGGVAAAGAGSWSRRRERAGCVRGEFELEKNVRVSVVKCMCSLAVRLMDEEFTRATSRQDAQ
jgi:hypothetical protein